MGKQDYEHASAFQQAKRFCAEQLRGRFVGARVRRQLTYLTTLCTVAALLYAAVGDAWARPLVAALPPLGTSFSFAVLGGSTVTNIGSTVVTGDLGVNPGSAVIGFPPGIVIGGTIHAADAVAAQAQTDLTAAYNNLAGQACDLNLSGQDLVGKTLTSGVYCFDNAAQLTGQLTLDGQGDPAAVFVFQTGSTLTTGSGASVLLINSASDCNVFWQVGSSATLGTSTAFAGSVLALTSITLNTGASVLGRTLARNGAVTMDTNSISMLCTVATPTPTATDTATPVDTATPTPVDNATPTPVDNATPTPVDNATPTPVDNATLTPVDNATPTPVDNATPTSVNNASPTPVDNASPTPVNNATPTSVDNASPTPTLETGLLPPTGLRPVDEPNALTRTLYLPFLTK